MKLTDFGLIFVLIFICLSTVTDSKMQINAAVSIEQMKYNNALDSALSDALYLLVEKDDGNEITYNTTKAIDTFFSSLCINLGMNISDDNKEKIKEYIPVMIFVLNDGFIILHHEYVQEDTGLVDKFVCSRKTSFLSKDEKYFYLFELDDMVTIVNKEGAVRGRAQDIAKLYPDSLMKDMEEYNREKNRVIIDCITGSLKKYTSNEYIKNGNQNWNFYIPYNEDDIWNRTIKNIGLIAVFSGYPYSDTSLGYYSKFAFGGARIWKKE